MLDLGVGDWCNGWGLLGAFLSLLWVEIIRDIYHWLSHQWRWLYRLHGWHHRVFRRDLVPISEEIYRQAHWYHDVPESSLMLLGALGFWGLWTVTVNNSAGWTTVAIIYSAGFLLSAIARGLGIKGVAELTDVTHEPGELQEKPSAWLINRSYHWRHHFENQQAYYSGTLSLVDKFLGTAMSLKGKRIAVTGASGTLGQALLRELHHQGAKVIALSCSRTQISLEMNGEFKPLKTVCWQAGQEAMHRELLEKIDILVLNHGINVHGERTSAAVEESYEVNTWSQWRWMQLFLETVKSGEDRVRKEVWVNTSEAEVGPAFSPLYELSKRTLGELITLSRLDAPCIVRKLILGPFKSNLNPIGIMSADWVAQQIVGGVKRDSRNIIVTINPLTWVAFPPKEFLTSLYFRLFSQPTALTPTSVTSGSNQTE